VVTSGLAADIVSKATPASPASATSNPRPHSLPDTLAPDPRWRPHVPV